MYKFSFSLDDADYMDFNKYHLNTASANRKTILILRLFVPVALIALSLLSFVYREDGIIVPISSIIYIVISAGWFFAVKPLLAFSMKLNMKAMKKDGKLPYGKNVQIQFDEEGISEITEIAESKVKYSIIEKVAESNHAVYIYFGAAQAFIIPLSTFETQKQKNEFLAFINGKKPVQV